MEKNIKISRPSGEDDYKVLCAFKNDGNSYIILDSKLKDSNGNTVTFVCRDNNGSLEYIDGDEWKKVTSQLINIVKGNNGIEFVNVNNEYKASENIGHPIALKDAHIIALTNNYKTLENIETNELTNEINNELNTNIEEIKEPEVKQEDTLNNAIDKANETDIQMPVIDENLNNSNEIVNDNVIVQPAIEPNIISEPVVEEAPINDNMNVQTPEVSPIIENPVIENGPTVENQTPVGIEPQVVIQNNNIPEKNMSVEEIRSKINALCDLLIEKENQINEKEKMIDAKLQVANIAYNNAQNVNQMSNNETINIANYQTNDQSKTLSA